jgi:prepilin-type N-terminal cleavage/methylation domain-containing protein
MNNRQRKARPAGFTLIELLVAIGAVAVIAVGIAAIFASVGRTVAGGRRVGNLNQYAALIERQMRADFEAMTRDGVLLFRHELAFDGADIPLHAEDTNPRPRRVDQIIFFMRGEFTSSRSPVIPGVNATASEAMVRYGHALRLDPIEDYATDPAYERPQVDDGWYTLGPAGTATPYRTDLGLGDDTSPSTNPNLYASGWNLARSVTLLATPGSADQDLPPASDPIWGQLGISRDEALDNEIQIGAQPAASSVFTSLAGIFPTNPNYPPDLVRTASGDQPRRPSLASGVVDVATTDLAEIRRFITDIGANPWTIAAETDLFDPADPAGSLLDDLFSHSGGAGDARFMQRWMDDLFPAHTHPGVGAADDDQLGIRPRYEQTFPDLVGTLTDYDAGGGSVTEQNMRLADQLMLASAVFVPRCTEFIVEFSFGQTYLDPASPLFGSLIWFGDYREVTIDGVTRRAVDRYPVAYDPALPDNPPAGQVYEQEYLNLDGSTAKRTLDTGLVYRDIGPPDAVPTAHFGYIDPTYQPSGYTDPETVPWPWPKLIRVTMSLADPVDPSIEQTFQFIFETPDAR